MPAELLIQSLCLISVGDSQDRETKLFSGTLLCRSIPTYTYKCLRKLCFPLGVSDLSESCKKYQVPFGKIIHGLDVFFQITQNLEWSRNFHLEFCVPAGDFIWRPGCASSGLLIWGHNLHIDLCFFQPFICFQMISMCQAVFHWSVC